MCFNPVTTKISRTDILDSKKDTDAPILTLSQTKNFRLFQTERVCR